eukprot:2187072-Prymnesium_polylepis.1
MRPCERIHSLCQPRWKLGVQLLTRIERTIRAVPTATAAWAHIIGMPHRIVQCAEEERVRLCAPVQNDLIGEGIKGDSRMEDISREDGACELVRNLGDVCRMLLKAAKDADTPAIGCGRDGRAKGQWSQEHDGKVGSFVGLVGVNADDHAVASRERRVRRKWGRRGGWQGWR